jgi:ABC-type transport system involved in cytochrome c biogenesis ATPase subunit
MKQGDRMNLSRFKIKGLFGERDIDLTIHDNRLILVGENGTGKSTFLAFLFSILTGQWLRVPTNKFEQVLIQIDDTPITFTCNEVAFLTLERMGDAPFNSVRTPRNLYLLDLLKRDPELTSNPEYIASIAERSRLPPSQIERLLWAASIATKLSSDQKKKAMEKAVKLNSLLSSTRVLYLPTYRRIEKDLIELVTDAGDAEEIARRIARGGLGHREHDEFIELVEFGMSDVDSLLKKTTGLLADSLRLGHAQLAGDFLDGVIGDEFERIKKDELKKLDLDSMLPVFERLGRAASSDETIRKFRSILKRLDDQKARLTTRDKVLAYYWELLIELLGRQEEAESALVKFVDVCTSYLRPKLIEFNNRNFGVDLYSDDTKRAKLTLGSLSSGEKQIVSLFAHLYLSGQSKSYFIIVDEPELSLSIMWQRRLLPDILASNKAAGLLAVTHSPFIYDNELDKYAKAILDFTSTH